MDSDFPDGNGNPNTDDPNLNKQKYMDPDFDDEWENLTVPTDENTSSTEWKEVD